MSIGLGSKTTPAMSTKSMAIIVLIAWHRFAQAQNACVSLKASKACPAFAEYNVGLPGIIERFPFLNGTADVDSFDQRLLDYVSSADYLSLLGCTTEANVPQYSLTRLCAGIIQDTADSLSCNTQVGLSPPPLCQATCSAWVDSIVHITSDTTRCPNADRQQDVRNVMGFECLQWPEYNNVETQHCISGAMNEPGYCGFRNAAAANQYCNENGLHPCCSALKAINSQMFTIGLISVVMGAVVAVGLGAYLTFRFCCRQRKTRRQKAQDAFAMSMGSKESSHGTCINRSRRQSTSSTLATTIHASTGGDPSHPTLPKSVSDHRQVSDHADIASALLPARPTVHEWLIVIHPYLPNMDDEITLRIGDIVGLAFRFDDGWALGFNWMTGLKGAFPLVCATAIPSELVEQRTEADGQESAKTQIDGRFELGVSSSALSLTDPSDQRLAVYIKRNAFQVQSTNDATLAQAVFSHQKPIPHRTASMRTTCYNYKN